MACILCYKPPRALSRGSCGHPVCHECGARMRVLCARQECPVCRHPLQEVLFIEKGLGDKEPQCTLVDPKYGIRFQTEEIRKSFYELLENRCGICREVFAEFSGLKDHMRTHGLYYCDLCVDNLKIFPRERRAYTRQALALHRRKGDVDDKSHKGHPLCEFCDQRYMDTDELYRHLRREHLFCHFCDAEGRQEYYGSYGCLREHFRQQHFLCEEGHCAAEKFTSVFRSQIDLQAHKANSHTKQLTKAAAKQARTLELEFTLAPRNERGVREPMPSTSEIETASCREGTSKVKVPVVESTEEFPTLGNVNVTNTVKQSKRNVTIRSSVRPLEITDENFPALNTEGISKVNVVCNTPQKSSNVSIEVNGITNIRIRPNVDFSEPSTSNSSNSNSTQWNVLQWTCSKNEKPRKEIQTEDFPSLSKPKSKKESSITVVPSWGQSSKTTSDITKGKAKKKKVKNSNDRNEESTSRDNTENSSKNINVPKEKKSETEENGIRKRTELKIDSLNSNFEDDFPVLGGGSSSKPPPGFETTPPPGFCIKYRDSEADKHNLTFTNSSGETYTILPENYSYVPPPEFQKRNKYLVAKVNEVLLDLEKIEEFRNNSRLFRQGICSAKGYFDHCKKVISRDFENVFPELLVLLPDISKQQELYRVYKNECKTKGLEICATCGQILKSTDFRTHLTSHNLENHFPVLGKNNTTQKNSWVRK